MPYPKLIRKVFLGFSSRPTSSEDYPASSSAIQLAQGAWSNKILHMVAAAVRFKVGTFADAEKITNYNHCGLLSRGGLSASSSSD